MKMMVMPILIGTYVVENTNHTKKENFINA